jgi:adenosylcobinamide kinase/adenosylcobinamide-phosphate guanylyltransferase
MFKNKITKGCILIIGGAKSGKSRIALDICNTLEKKKIFLATAQALDEEMEERIGRHRRERGKDWTTVEEPVAITKRINELDTEDSVILVDCLTLWISNLFMKYDNSLQHIQEEIEVFLNSLTQVRGVVIIVSNEVGMGIVPDNELARAYRDVAGSLNQRIAAFSEKVGAVIAGIPVILKDGES